MIPVAIILFSIFIMWVSIYLHLLNKEQKELSDIINDYLKKKHSL